MWSFFLLPEINSCQQLNKHFPIEHGLANFTEDPLGVKCPPMPATGNMLLFRTPCLIWLQLPSGYQVPFPERKTKMEASI
ncbi:hypothetical protein I79_006556 [Cricetulus griseus]|uniref:Uncharacterized protein n=1 Tax=Cricetulus griseus TaxID=10029 RepID=G3H858_CRIGR|nr:hypothetical protein I79_006556 [Cricetulus griseus]